MSGPVRAVIFDLDGTLVQTRIASWEIFEQVNRRHRLGVDSPEEFFALFRGNIFAELSGRCRDAAHADEVKQEFLALLRSDYSPPLVPGMRDVVRRLASECTLAVMSSNAMTVLRRVLVENDIAYCFAHVFGGDVAPDKRAAIRAFLADSGSGFGRRCAADYDEGNRMAAPDPESTVLVTDTAGDVRDASEVGIRVVGVTWGMHSADELAAAGAEFVALWPQEVAAYLVDDAARPATGACALPAPPGGTGPAPVLSRVDDVVTAAPESTMDARRDRRRAAAGRWQDDAPHHGVTQDGATRNGAQDSPGPGGTARNGAPDGGGNGADELLAAVRLICPGG